MPRSKSNRLWAILHEPSGKFLPRGYTRRGATHVEITDEGIPPRLFMTAPAAAASLRVWLEGTIEVEDATPGELRVFQFGHTNVETIPRPDRKAKRSEFKIVKVKVVLDDE